jgi:hypothetical protein
MDQERVRVSEPDVQSPGPGAPVSKQALAALAAVLGACGVYYALVVTHGALVFHGHEPEWRLFTGMWQSLRQGRFDIDRDMMEGEIFNRDGKTYSYYGIFPALLRGLVLLYRPLDRIGFQEQSCVLAAVVATGGYLFAGVRLGLHRGRSAPWFVLFMASTAFGTPVLICLATASVFNEAVLWAAAWGSVFNAALVLFAEAPGGSKLANRSLVVMAVAAGFTLHSRVATGAGVVLELVGVAAFLFFDAARSRTGGEVRALPGRRALIAAGALTVFFWGAQAFVNYERWGSPLEFRPIQRLQQFEGTPRGWAEARTGTFRADRLTSSACFYLLPEPENFLSHWPFLATGGKRCFMSDYPWEDLSKSGWQQVGILGVGSGLPYFDLISGPRMPITVACPALVLFALAGGEWTRLRRWREWRHRAGLLMVVSGLTVLGALLTFDTLALRFLGDLVPFLTGLGFLTVVHIADGRGPEAPRRSTWIGAMSLAVAFSVFASHITMLRFKSETYGVGKELRQRIRNVWLNEE